VTDRLRNCAGLDKYAAWMIATLAMYIAVPGFEIVICQVISFTLFWLFGVSMSLFNRASNVDGEGVHFNTEVFC